MGVNHGGAGLGSRYFGTAVHFREGQLELGLKHEHRADRRLHPSGEDRGHVDPAVRREQVLGGAAAGAAEGDDTWKSTQKRSESNREMEGEGNRAEESTDLFL